MYQGALPLENYAPFCEKWSYGYALQWLFNFLYRLRKPVPFWEKLSILRAMTIPGQQSQNGKKRKHSKKVHKVFFLTIWRLLLLNYDTYRIRKIFFMLFNSNSSTYCKKLVKLYIIYRKLYFFLFEFLRCTECSLLKQPIYEISWNFAQRFIIDV